MKDNRNSGVNKQDWCTPIKYLDTVQEFFGEIELDPCWNKNSKIVCSTKYELPHKDGLTSSWDYKTIFVNPSYGRSADGTRIYNWLERCRDANLKFSSEVISLIPVATNTRHWREFIFNNDNVSICFIYEPRVKFENGVLNKGAPMACAFIYWGNMAARFQELFSIHGYVMHNNLDDKWEQP